MLFDTPTKEEYREIIENYPFDESILRDDNFEYTVHQDGSIDGFHSGQQLSTWDNHLRNRMYQTRWSWVYLTYLFNKGIPDDEWYISPGRSGESIEYFPHFEERHHFIKAQFDYFADVFYYKFFSAWDTLGHIINHMYGLGIDRADFRKAVQGLKTIRPDLHEKLNNLIRSDDFSEMMKYRHSSTHNELVGHVGSGSTKVSESEYHLGVGNYTPSAKIKENTDKSLLLFTNALEIIREQVEIDLKS
jgi:Cthe_2314-like HEPN